MTDISQVKLRLGQGRAGLRCKIITLIPINKPIVQAMENPTKVLAPKVQDKVILMPNYVIPQMKHKGDSSSRKTIQDVIREIPIYPDPAY